MEHVQTVLGPVPVDRFGVTLMHDIWSLGGRGGSSIH